MIVKPTKKAIPVGKSRLRFVTANFGRSMRRLNIINQRITYTKNTVIIGITTFPSFFFELPQLHKPRQ